MDQKQIVRQMMEFNKNAFNNSLNAMSALQDQTEKLVLSFLDSAPWFPAEGKKVISDWVNSYKKGREDFKAAADENYKKVAAYFAEAETQQKTKKKK